MLKYRYSVTTLGDEYTSVINVSLVNINFYINVYGISVLCDVFVLKFEGPVLI